MEQTLSESFFYLYRGMREAYGQFIPDDSEQVPGEKAPGSAWTENNLYSSLKWDEHFRGKRGLGVIPLTEESTCFWGAIDIDDYDIDLVALSKRIDKENLPFVLLRSKSGGAHVTMFFSEGIPCNDVRKKLREYSILLGYPTCEIFPKQDRYISGSFGNWLNMPYFGGKSTTRCALVDGVLVPHPEKFLVLASNKRLTLEKFKELNPLGEEKCENALFSDGPICLQRLNAAGKISEGKRNDVMFAVALYSIKKHGDTEKGYTCFSDLGVEMLESPLQGKEMLSIWKSANKKGYTYQCKNPVFKNVCDRENCRKRKYGVDGHKLFDFDVIQVEKMLGDPGHWVLTISTVDKTDIIQFNTAEFFNQGIFSRKMLDKFSMMMPKIKSQDWTAFMTEIAERAIEVEIPDEANPYRYYVMMLGEYIMQTGEIVDLQEMRNGLVFKDEKGFSYFYVADFCDFVTRKTGRMHNPTDVWTKLREANCVKNEVVINSVKTTLWGVETNVVTRRVRTGFDGEAF